VPVLQAQSPEFKQQYHQKKESVETQLRYALEQSHWGGEGKMTLTRLANYLEENVWVHNINEKVSEFNEPNYIHIPL
jgi:hypothetical protein